MLSTNSLKKKKEKKSKDKTVVVTAIDNNCSFLIYYDNGVIKKSKAFYYPLYSTNSQRKKIDKKINAEYKLWLHCLWYYGYLEEDDIQLIEYKHLTKDK